MVKTRDQRAEHFEVQHSEVQVNKEEPAKETEGHCLGGKSSECDGPEAVF